MSQESLDRASTLAERGIIAGSHVRINGDIERFPHCVVYSGATGVITAANGHEVYVKLNDYLPGLEEWNNELHFYLDWEWHWNELLNHVEVLSDEHSVEADQHGM